MGGNGHKGAIRRAIPQGRPGYGRKERTAREANARPEILADIICDSHPSVSLLKAMIV